MDNWGEFLGFIIVALITVVSWVAKMREERQETTKRAQRKAQRTSPKEMPEATRRMLYGDSGRSQQRKGHVEVRTAKVKNAQPVEVPRREPGQSAVPAPPAKPFLSGGTAAPPPVPQRRAQQKQAEVELHPREVLEDLWQQAMAQKKKQQQLQQRQRRRQQQQAQRPEHRHERDERKKQAALAKRRAIAEAKQQKALAQRQRTAREQGKIYRPMPTAATSLASILNNPADLRKGILLQEILGTPKGLQEP